MARGVDVGQAKLECHWSHVQIARRFDIARGPGRVQLISVGSRRSCTRWAVGDTRPRAGRWRLGRAHVFGRRHPWRTRWGEG